MFTEIYYKTLNKLQEYEQKINELKNKEIFVIAEVNKYTGSVVNAWYVDTEEEAKTICNSLNKTNAMIGYEYSFAKVKKIKEI